MKKDGRDLVAQFGALAPERRPISLQRWGFMRIGLALALVFGGFLALQATAGIFTSDLQVAGTPNCGTDNLMILMAQAVPSAESVPCISSLPAGWKLGGVEIRRGQGRFWLDSDQGGKHAVEARLLPPEKCDLSGTSEVPSDEDGTRRYEKPEKLPPDLRSTRSYVFEGGCVTYQFEFHGNASASLMFDADGALAFQPRASLVAFALLAPPASLVIGEHPGLVVAPRPLRAVRTRIAVLRRYRELVSLVRREGFGPFMSASGRAGRSVEGAGIRIRRVLEEARGGYIKLRPIAATPTYFFPRATCEELAERPERRAPQTAARHPPL